MSDDMASEPVRVDMGSPDFAGASRQEGCVIRSRLSSLLAAHETVIIDLDGAEAMTPSFVDECFGKLLLELGEEAFRSRVSFEGSDKSLKRLVNQVLRARLAEIHNSEQVF